MKKIKNRAYFSLLLALGLIFGLCIFAGRLLRNGEDWVMLRANQSVFHNGALDRGRVTDCNDKLLAAAGNGVYYYADDETVRKASLHAVGDFGGNIGSGAITVFNQKLAGYSLINGVASMEGKGGTVRLSIDANLNAVAYQALGGRRGAVLVMNYKTGEILCMVSAPSYDPANPPDLSAPAYEGAFINRGLGATFVPGSVFKLVTLAAAIEQLPDLESRRFSCAGGVTVDGEYIKCTAAHGEQTIEQALANSCNVAFSELSQELGAEAIYSYAHNYGFLESLSVSGIETAAGSLDKPEAGTGRLSWMGIGQDKDLVSPIAMLRLSAAIANNGQLQAPVLLKGAHSASKQLMEKSTAGRLRDFMSYNLVYSYGQERFPDLKICAKTGTAELGDGTSHAWFTGFLDDTKNPLAFTVLVEQGGGGLATAGPIANAVLQAAVK